MFPVRKVLDELRCPAVETLYPSGLPGQAGGRPERPGPSWFTDLVLQGRFSSSGFRNIKRCAGMEILALFSSLLQLPQLLLFSEDSP